MKLIDADRLKNELRNTLKYEPQIVHIIVNEAIDDAPTVDQWHYPSKGEYPKEDELVLCLQCDGIIPFIGIYNNNKWFDWYTKFMHEFEPKCWQYIVPPKEEA